MQASLYRVLSEGDSWLHLQTAKFSIWVWSCWAPDDRCRGGDWCWLSGFALWRSFRTAKKNSVLPCLFFYHKWTFKLLWHLQQIQWGVILSCKIKNKRPEHIVHWCEWEVRKFSKTWNPHCRRNPCPWNRFRSTHCFYGSSHQLFMNCIQLQEAQPYI